MTDLICTKCRDRLILSLCPPKKEDVVAASLEGQVRQYCEALVDRRMSLGAADRFYRDLMVYQWRLNALDVQIRAVDTALGHVQEARADAESLGGVLEACLSELERQHAEAVSALEERASHYAISAPTCTGHITRFAASESERQVAINHYRELAKDTFNEATCEAHVISQLAVDEKALRQFRTALECRVSFWQTQLEETWGAWHDVTARMHRTGEAAMVAWRGVVTDLELVRQCLQESTSKTSLQQALVAFAAQGLEVELVNSIGLSGLSSLIEEDEDAIFAHAFSQDARVHSLISVLGLLRHAGFLHEVGQALAEALLDQDDIAGMLGSSSAVERELDSKMRPLETVAPRALGHASQKPLDTPKPVHTQELRTTPSTPSISQNAPATPVAAAAIHLASAARLTPSAVVRLAAAPAAEAAEERGVSRLLIPWLVESLVLATRKAVDRGAGSQLTKLLKLSRSLRNDELEAAVQGAASQQLQKRRNFWTTWLASYEDEATKAELVKELSIFQGTGHEDLNDREEVLVVLPDKIVSKREETVMV